MFRFYPHLFMFQGFFGGRGLLLFFLSQPFLMELLQLFPKYIILEILLMKSCWFSLKIFLFCLHSTEVQLCLLQDSRLAITFFQQFKSYFIIFWLYQFHLKSVLFLISIASPLKIICLLFSGFQVFSVSFFFFF